VSRRESLLNSIRRVCLGLRRVPLVALLAMAGSSSGQTQSSKSEFWPELDVFLNLNQDSRLYFMYSGVRQSDLTDYADGEVGGFYDFFLLPMPGEKPGQHPNSPRYKFLMLRGGFEYSTTPAGNSKPSTQYIPVILIDARFRLPWHFLLAERNRGDLRVVNGVFSPIYRNRLRLERPFRAGRFQLAPFAQAEVFYSAQADEFNQFRYSIGLDWVMVRHAILEPYYTREHNVKISTPNVNALGIKLELYFR